MRLSHRSEYALLALVHLARHEAGGLLTVQAIAEAQADPRQVPGADPPHAEARALRAQHEGPARRLPPGPARRPHHAGRGHPPVRRRAGAHRVGEPLLLRAHAHREGEGAAQGVPADPRPGVGAAGGDYHRRRGGPGRGRARKRGRDEGLAAGRGRPPGRRRPGRRADRIPRPLPAHRPRRLRLRRRPPRPPPTPRRSRSAASRPGPRGS